MKRLGRTTPDHHQVSKERDSTGYLSDSLHDAYRVVAFSSRLVTLRHHPSIWLLPAGLLILALLPWPYGYYSFLRIIVCAAAAWAAYTQWRHDEALSGWVVVLGATVMLYNPIIPVFLTREIWSVLNLLSTGVFVGHLWTLGKLANYRAASVTVLQDRSLTDTRSRSLRNLASRLFVSRDDRPK